MFFSAVNRHDRRYSKDQLPFLSSAGFRFRAAERTGNSGRDILFEMAKKFLDDPWSLSRYVPQGFAGKNPDNPVVVIDATDEIAQ